MKILNINLAEIENSSVEELKKMVRNVDTENLRQEFADKETLRIYRVYKSEVKEISWFDNTLKTNLLLRARTDTLELNWRKKHQNKEISCVCGYENETLEHFILYCNLYDSVRVKYGFLQHPCTENEILLLADILCFNIIDKEKIELRKNFIQELWKVRKLKIQSCQ